MDADSEEMKMRLAHSISTSNLENAAVEAAIADGILKGSKIPPDSRAKKAGIRRGKWTAEEEAYSNQLIQEFKAGLLPLTDGTTLRTFLSKLLNCDPMRISKKFVGGNCIGKQVFRRRQADIDKLTSEQMDEGRKLLSELERRFLERVAQTNRVKVPGVNLSENGMLIIVRMLYELIE
jgi:vacuolar-type H+-ATPase subunit B/Vma2